MTASNRKLTFSGVWPLLKNIFSAWSDNKVPKMSAALAYYTTISIAPLLVVILKITSVFLTSDVSSTQLKAQLDQLMGADAAKGLQDIITQAGQKGAGTVATVVSVIIALVGASGVFVELQDSLNTIWGVRPKPNRGILGFILDRSMSMSMVLGIAFLLLVSMFVSTVANTVSSEMLSRIFHADGYILKLTITGVEIVLSTAIVSILFAAIFKILPDAKVGWADVGLGAGITAVLFSLGKFGLAQYFHYLAPGSAYGAAGSLVAAIVWVYYSSLILYFGAEFTKVYSETYGSQIVPTKNAELLTDEMRAKAGVSETPAKAAPTKTQPFKPGTSSTDLPSPRYRPSSSTSAPGIGSRPLRPRWTPRPTPSGRRTAAVFGIVPLLLTIVVGRLVLRRYFHDRVTARGMRDRWITAAQKWKKALGLMGADKFKRFATLHGPDGPDGESWSQWIRRSEDAAAAGKI